MRKYLLWDNDGVLVDTERWYFEATRECLAILGHELDHATYLTLMADGRGYWDRLRAAGFSEQQIAEARRTRDQLYQEHLTTQAIEIEGVMDVLDELSRAYRMAIVSTSRREDFDLIHHARDMRRYFEFVITGNDCAMHKPSPEPYEQALRRFSAAPGDALAIEDTSRGLRSAMAAGLDCVIIRNEFTAAQDFAGAWRVLDSIRDLPTLLASA
jgi:HAD superfamily hydrolase (TIGR01509 family)